MSADEIVIVGAGPAGLLLAWQLASNGLPVRVLERHADFSREFRGEFLQPSGLAQLEAIGALAALRARRACIDVKDAKIYLGERLVIHDEEPGLAVSQPALMGLLDEACGRFPHYRLEREANVTAPILEDGRATGVVAKRGG